MGSAQTIDMRSALHYLRNYALETAGFLIVPTGSRNSIALAQWRPLAQLLQRPAPPPYGWPSGTLRELPGTFKHKRIHNLLQIQYYDHCTYPLGWGMHMYIVWRPIGGAPWVDASVEAAHNPYRDQIRHRRITTLSDRLMKLTFLRFKHLILYDGDDDEEPE